MKLSPPCRLWVLALGASALLVLLIAQPTVAQPVDAAPKVHWPARFQQGDDIPGRPMIATLSMLQDRHGFLWFGTEDGLHRYDGFQSVIFRPDPSDPRSISANAVVDIVEDRDGLLWLATRGGGISRFSWSTESFDQLRHQPDDPTSLSSDDTACLLEDQNGTLWVGADGALHQWQPDNRTFQRHLVKEDSGFGVSALFEDPRRGLWVGTTDGLVLYDPQEGTATSYRHDPAKAGSLTAGPVTAIAAADEGRLWVATPNGLNLFDPWTGASQRFVHDPNDPGSLTHNRVSDLHRDSEGDLWIATFGGGIDRYREQEGVFRHHRHDPNDPRSVGGDGIVDIYEDRNGILWFGTFSGLNKYDRRQEQFNVISTHTLGGRAVLAIWQENNGDLWVGGNDILRRVDRKTGEVERFEARADIPGALPSGYVTALWRDEQHVEQQNGGDLFVGTWGGLCRLNRSNGSPTFSCYRRDPEDPRSLPHNSVRSLSQDRRGRLWVGTNGGLARFNLKTETFLRVADEPGAPEQMRRETFAMVTEDRVGVLWLASSGGLYRWEKGFQLFQHDPADPRSLSNNRLTAVHEDRRGDLWVATFGGGLNRLDRADGTFQRFSKKDGLSSDTVTSILEDENGVLWLGTYDKLSRFDPQSGRFSNYGMSDGLAGRVMPVYSYFRGRDGEMFFGSQGGLNTFYPDQVGDDPEPPPVALTAFHLFDEPAPLRGLPIGDPANDPNADSPLEQSITETQALVLNHRQNVFAFEFAALSFRDPAQNQYAYKLEGFEDQWIAADAEQRRVRYTNLDADTYVFRVRAANANGVWNEAGAAVEIRVLPPPWQTWWAYTLYALLALTMVSGALRAQQKKLARERRINDRLREVDRLKDDFLANTSHELRTPLYGITGLAESLIDGARGDLPPAAQEDLSLLVASGRRLASLVNDILDFSKLRHHSLPLDRRPVDLHALTQVVITLSKPLLGDKELTLHNNIATDLPAVDADENRLQQILHNLIGNAVKFTAEGTVEVSALQQEDMIRVQVRDTGPGILETQKERLFQAFEQADTSTEREFGGTGLGLAVTRQLVELHGGRIDVESAPGQGSTFFLTLPVSSEPAAAREPLLTQLTDDDPEAQIESPPAESMPPPVDMAEDETIAGRQKGAHILVVDDEPVIRRILVNQMRAQGYRLRQAENGTEALQRVDEKTPDLILLDVMMPRMSGYEVCRAIRRRYPMEELPILFLTAKNQVEDLVVGLAAGANDYLPKPISRSELVSRVKTHLALLSVHRKLRHVAEERSDALNAKERLLEERKRLIGELEQRNAELARFNYTVSHDLKNPLVTIKNFLGVVRKDAAEGRSDLLEDHLERLDTAAGEMQRLLEELYEFSRIGVEANTSESLPFGELVEIALEELAPTIRAHRIQVDVAREFPTIYGDHPRLLNLLRHLLRNAVEQLGHTERHTQQPQITIGMADYGHPDDMAVFFVRDNGPGIDPRYHDRIFNLFEKLSPGQSEGTGIGLAIAKRIVETHDGEIWVESEGVGQGSTFYFSLPLLVGFEAVLE